VDSAAPFAALEVIVDRFFAGVGTGWARAPGVVAFSGGADSTALAAVLARRARRTGTAVVAAHFDHGLDPGSAARAAAAAAAAGRLGLPLVAERAAPPPGERRAAGPEAAARRRRYRFLAAVARRHGASWVATAHHRDDQAETVLLRLLFGSGIEGLAGIAPVAELAPGLALLRPLLAVGRREVEAALAAAGLPWIDDPTNRHAEVPRNRVRHHLLPALARRDGTGPEELAGRLAAVAAAASGAREAVARHLARRVDLRPGELAVPSVDLAALAALPADLLPPALALLHRAAGDAYPPPAAARRELVRQLAERAERANDGAGAGARGRLAPAGRPLAADAGRGWRWREEDGRLRLHRAAPGTAAPGFSYTLTVPGEIDVPEAGLTVRVGQQPRAPWMLRGSRQRAAMALPLAPGDRVVVRSRRPGDRLRPLGAAGSRRLKEILIDHRMPRRERDHVPLLCLGSDGEEIAWVPGVTIGHRHRLLDSGAGGAVWVAEVVATPREAGGATPATAGGRRGIGCSEQPLVETR
jgi:tRNA(Ile)-lysidine synthase